MERIESFKIDHLKLQEGLYVSRYDTKQSETVTTFDLRFTKPNKMPAMEMAAIHTIEHLGATFLRNSTEKENIVYFGPMGCRTGFYLLMFGKLKSEDVYNLVLEMCDFIIGFEGGIPGATAIECGNYKDQDLDKAKLYTKRYKTELSQNKNFYYE